MNLFSGHRNAFVDESEHVGLLFAAHSAVALVGARKVAGLTAALSNRDVIGQAKGILMERFKITGEQAFRLLVQASQHLGRRLHDIAAELAPAANCQPPGTDPKNQPLDPEKLNVRRPGTAA